MKTLEKIIGAVLFTVLIFIFGRAIGGMAEQGVSDSERYALEAKLDELDSKGDEMYIAPADEVLIEFMEKNHERP